MRAGRRRRAALAAVLLAVSLAACAAPGKPDAANAPAGAGAATGLTGTLTVFAASSLKQAFTDLANRFEAAHPAVRVALSFDGSSTLASQILQGAPADVFAAADEATMGKVRDAALTAGPPAVFATNVLTIAVPPNNPAGITSFADLARPGVKVVVCAAQVPCGAVARADAARAGVELAPVSEELSVTGVLGKVTSGEADAGLVYVTDAKTAGPKVAVVPLTLASPAVNNYSIAAVAASKRQDLADAFIALVTGATGRAVLQAAGFGTP
ncbi:molybdate ABC transporter substrate-binding protein [Specibacter sp. RAF43]|uniref:molybdate ABC transporter substrate-binding protein n=1 Tax=Specibacter sp. RAF43 TaxID=3233057 RepID=UPI003F990FFC